MQYKGSWGFRSRPASAAFRPPSPDHTPFAANATYTDYGTTNKHGHQLSSASAPCTTVRPPALIDEGWIEELIDDARTHESRNIDPVAKLIFDVEGVEEDGHKSQTDKQASSLKDAHPVTEPPTNLSVEATCFSPMSASSLTSSNRHAAHEPS